MFLFSLSIALVFVSTTIFLCKIMVVSKVVNQMIVQITQLIYIRVLLFSPYGILMRPIFFSKNTPVRIMFSELDC